MYLPVYFPLWLETTFNNLTESVMLNKNKWQNPILSISYGVVIKKISRSCPVSMACLSYLPDGQCLVVVVDVLPIRSTSKRSGKVSFG